MISHVSVCLLAHRENGSIPNTFCHTKRPCVMEMWITGYSAMENAIHSTWKSKGQLSHVLQTELPTIPKEQNM